MTTVVDFTKKPPKKATSTNGAMPDEDFFGGEHEKTEKPRSASAADIIRGWRDEGPLVRIPTGLPSYDDASHGGIPIPWRVTVVGAPSAGKTALENYLARRFATENNLEVGILAVDEDEDDQTIRQAMMAGFSLAECERRDPAVLEQMASALADLNVHFYSLDWTIEAAAADLAERARLAGRKAAFFVDTAHTVTSASSGAAKSEREIVVAIVKACRSCATRHRMMVVLLAEANRDAYKNHKPGEETNDLASGADSRAFEFGAQTLFMLRTPKGHANVIHVSVAKNRRAQSKFDFWIEFDRERHALRECGDPTAIDAQEFAAEKDHKERRAVKAAVLADAGVLAAVVRSNPGIGERSMRAKLKASGHGWGPDRIDAAKEVLVTGWKGDRLVDRGEKRPGMPTKWHLERTAEGGES